MFWIKKEEVETLDSAPHTRCNVHKSLAYKPRYRTADQISSGHATYCLNLNLYFGDSLAFKYLAL